MMRMMGLALLALLAAWASADTVPLDAKIRPVGGSAGRTWHFAAEEVKLGGKPYRTHAYLQNADGDRADGWIRFDVTDWERFTATVGVNDRWLDTAGALIIEVDGKKTAEITKRSGEAPQQVDLPLIGATTLTFRFVLAILLAEPALARLDPAVLQITTTPAGATVVVEGQPAATVSPCTVAVPMRGRATREVEIRVDLRIYSTLTRTVAVNAGQTITLALT
ncbi:MAG TPA: PEGA domain-containing protein, partial [Armatimonadota bacterium]|nr:PEGA domain-containing protein [Armatimonadota bacterium]